MRRIYLLLITLLIVNVSFAQNNKVVSAYNYLRYGELDKAKEAIDAALKHPKTMDNEKTWFYKAKIYFEIATTKEYQSLDPNADVIAYEALKKALLLNFKDPENQKLDLENNTDDMLKFWNLIKNQKTQYVSSEHLAEMLLQHFPRMANHFANTGDIELRENKDYDKALEDFERILFISDIQQKTDTVVYYYAAYAAEKAKNYEKAKTYYKKLAKMKYGKNEDEKAKVYYSLSKIYEAEGDTTQYLETLKKGREKYPSALPLLFEEINYNISIGQPKAAEDLMKIAAEKQPDNKLLHYNLGTIYERDTTKNRFGEAEAAYMQAIKIDSNYFDALYNLGGLYYNKGAEIIMEANALPLSKTKEYEELKAKAVDNFNKALPYLERAHAANPKDKNTLNSLWQAYRKVENLDKASEIKKKLDALKDK